MQHYNCYLLYSAGKKTKPEVSTLWGFRWMSVSLFGTFILAQLQFLLSCSNQYLKNQECNTIIYVC